MASSDSTQGLRGVHSLCTHDGPDTCRVRVHLDAAGRAVRIQGDPQHSVTQGFLCGKVAKYLDRVYSPGRLLHPMRRRGRLWRRCDILFHAGGGAPGRELTPG